MADKGKVDDKLIEKAAKIILGTQAQSRFTKTPITISDYGKLFKGFDTEGTYAGNELNQPSTGKYTYATPTSPGQINIRSSYVDNPNYQDIQSTIHHEDIHALLDKAGYKYPVLPETQLGPYEFGMHDDPITKATLAFIKGHRAGNIYQELPAYAGAYNPQELPEFTEGDRQRYLSRLYQTLQPDTANMLNRIISNFSASQNSPFTVSSPPVPEPK
jgi:hypothetical protein